MYTLRLHSPFSSDEMTLSPYIKKKREVIRFIKENTGKMNGTEVFWYCGLYQKPFDDILDELEAEGLIKWSKTKQTWNYVSDNRGKNKER